MTAGSLSVETDTSAQSPNFLLVLDSSNYLVRESTGLPSYCGYEPGRCEVVSLIAGEVQAAREDRAAGYPVNHSIGICPGRPDPPH